MSKKIKRPGSFVWTCIQMTALILMMAVLTTVGVKASNRNVSVETQKIRVAYYQDGGYYCTGPQGVKSGYNVGFLYEIAKYNDWSYEFVEYGSFEDALEGLNTGEVDILPALMDSKERRAKFLYSKESMAKIYVTLIVPKENESVVWGDIEDLEGKAVGIMKGSVDGVGARAFLKAKKIKVKIREYAGEEELLNALDSGEVSAVGITYMGSNNKYHIVAEFHPQNLYFAMPKDRTELMGQLDEAMNLMSLRNTDFRARLYQKYLAKQEESQISLSAKEREYIKTSGTISVAVPCKHPPLAYYGNDGKLTGALLDYFEQIAGATGLHFRFVPVESQKKAIDYLKKKKVQVIAMLTLDPTQTFPQGVRQTNSYLELYMYAITREGTGRIDTLAVPEDLQILFETKNDQDKLLRDVESTYFENGWECMRALNKGKVDGVFCNSFFVNYYLNHSRVAKYSVTALSGYSYGISMGVEIGTNNELYHILNGYVDNSGSSNINSLMTRYSMEEDRSLTGIISRMPTSVVMGYTLVLAVAVVWLIILLVMLRKRYRVERELIADQEKVRQEVKASKDRTIFFGTVSHDMRTPLNAIIGYTELALEEKMSDKVNEYFRKIQSSGKLLLELINDTLTVARTESKELMLEPAATSCDEMLEEVLAPVRLAAVDKGVAFQEDIADTKGVWLLVDALGLKKIIMNLLSNAIKFTPEGGSVSFTMKHETGDGWMIQVKDTGIGVSEEFLPKMFDLFAQERREGREAVPGTGMGLEIVKRLVEAMKGTIRVYSRLNQGTKFIIRIKLPKASPQKQNQDQGPICMDYQGRHVLLCEDNPINVEITKTLLEKVHLTVDVAENGQEGINKYQEEMDHYYSLVLLDIRMPIMDGYQTAEGIRSSNRADAQRIPIIALSANAFSEDVKKSMDAGMNAHLAKPVQPEELYRALDRWVQKK